MREVEQYIKTATRSVRHRGRRRDIARELMSHALDIRDEYLRNARSLSEREMELEIIKRLGDVMELETQLSRANETLWQKWISRIFLAVVGVALIGTLVMVAVSTQTAMTELKVARAEMNRNFASFIKDQEALSANPFLSMRDGKNSSATFIVEKLKSISIPDQVRKEVRGISYAQHFDPSTISSAVQQIDLSWMHELRALSFGAFTFQDSYSGRVKMTLLMDVARVRLAQGLNSKQPLAAIQDVMALAQVVQGHGTLIGEMVALALVRYAAAVQTYSLEHHLLDRPIEGLPDVDTIAKMRRAKMMMASVVTGLETPENIQQEVLKHPEWTVGLCGSIAEAQNGYLPVYQRYFSDNFSWGPVSMSSNEKFLEQLQKRDSLRCGLNEPQAMVSNVKEVEDDVGSMLPVAVRRVGARIPILRSALGLMTANIIALKDFGGYDATKWPAIH